MKSAGFGARRRPQPERRRRRAARGDQVLSAGRARVACRAAGAQTVSLGLGLPLLLGSDAGGRGRHGRPASSAASRRWLGLLAALWALARAAPCPADVERRRRARDLRRDRPDAARSGAGGRQRSRRRCGSALVAAPRGCRGDAPTRAVAAARFARRSRRCRGARGCARRASCACRRPGTPATCRRSATSPRPTCSTSCMPMLSGARRRREPHRRHHPARRAARPRGARPGVPRERRVLRTHPRIPQQGTRSRLRALDARLREGRLAVVAPGAPAGAVLTAPGRAVGALKSVAVAVRVRALCPAPGVGAHRSQPARRAPQPSTRSASPGSA